MAKVRQVRTNFNAGELMPVLDHRADIDAYHNGAARIRNFRILPQGGLTRRSGTRYAWTLTDNAWQAEDFVFDESQAYIFLFRQGFVDIFDEDGVGLTTVAGPWTDDMLGQLSVAQTGDTMFVAHRLMQMQKIVRTGAATFTVSSFAFDIGVTGADSAPAQPYFKYAPPTSTMTVEFDSYPGGSTTFVWSEGYRQGTRVKLTCSDAIFQTTMVGYHVRVGKHPFLIDTRINDNQAWCILQSSQLYLQLGSNPLRTVAASSWIVVSDPFHGFSTPANVYITGAAGVAATPSTGINGQRVTVANTTLDWTFNSTTVATEVIHGGGDGIRYWADAFSTRDWQEPAFSPIRGWPASVTLDDQRLVIGGAAGLPNRLFTSRTDAPLNFDAGSGRDNESIQAGIQSQRVAIINAVVSFKHLQIFTTEGEYFCPGSEQKPLSPATISFKRQSAYGIRPIPPVEFDGSTLYLTPTAALREFLYDGDNGGYQSPSLSFMAQHLLTGIGIEPIRLESQAEGSAEQQYSAYIVRADGRLAVLSFSRQEKILGWTLWETDGQIMDIVSVRRRLYLVVRRGAGAGIRVFLEELSGSHTLDCATRQLVGAPQTGWGGLNIYNNTTIHALINNREDVGPLLVSSNAVTLPRPATAVEFGYGFDCDLTTLPPELNLQDGPTQGQPRRVVRVMLEVEDATTAAVRGTHITLKSAAAVNAPLVPYTGSLEFWPRGWDTAGQVTVTCPEQGKLTIKSLLKELEF